MNSLRTKRCSYCLMENDLQQCLSCNLFKYCNKECQKKDWNEHKHECKNIQKISHDFRRSIPATVLMMARIIYKIHKNQVCGQSKLLYCNKNVKFPENRNFNELVSHYDNISRDQYKMECLNTYTQALFRILPKHLYEMYQHIFKDIFCKILINSYSILDEELCPVAHALYMCASYFNHSCVPNTNCIFNGPNIFITSVEDITLKQNSSSLQNSIFIRYIDPLESYQNRRKSLMETYYFHCACQFCHIHDDHHNHEENVLDFLPKSTLENDTLNINTRQSSITNKFIDELCSKFQEYQQSSISLKNFNDFFPSSNNVIYNKILWEKFQHTHMPFINNPNDLTTVADTHLVLTYQIGIALNRGNTFRKYYPKYDISRAYHLLWLSKLALYLNDLSNAKNYANQCMEIIDIAYPLEAVQHLDNFESILSNIKYNLSHILSQLNF
ncbi:unnamed protein product [Gordionus sp. m RMFG-2023]